ncbi:MAG: U4/U6-U5 snRNP complex subunit dib1 [Candelina mexicana]|nr:MAG: U4/U6-U5 snRNP complex subunit dib1 [Candelina mexicana]
MNAAREPSKKASLAVEETIEKLKDVIGDGNVDPYESPSTWAQSDLDPLAECARAVIDLKGWHVDQAIMSEEERLVVIRFGRDWDADCMKQDEVLYRIADRVKNFAVIYVCDLDQVPDFKQMYELYDPMTLMFFFRNKHMMCDFGTGNNNKLNWVLDDKQELIDIIETIYKGAKKGRGLVVSPKGSALPTKTRLWLNSLRLFYAVQILEYYGGKESKDSS